SEVKVNGLSLRSEPRLSDRSWVSALPKNQRVEIIPGESEFRNNVSRVKVRVIDPPPGCPDTGYVAEPYLKSVDHFANLAVVKETQDCGDGNCGNGKVGPRTGDPIKDLDKVGQGLGDAIKDENGPG